MLISQRAQTLAMNDWERLSMGEEIENLNYKVIYIKKPSINLFCADWEYTIDTVDRPPT